MEESRVQVHQDSWSEHEAQTARRYQDVSGYYQPTDQGKVGIVIDNREVAEIPVPKYFGNWVGGWRWHTSSSRAICRQPP